MKKYITLILTSAFFCWTSPVQAAAELPNTDENFYEWVDEVAGSSGCSDYIPVFRKIFSLCKVKSFLQFGVGYSTKYFLDSCRKVISVELVSHGYGPDWMIKCMNLYQDYSNWIPYLYFTGYKGDTDWATYKYLASDHVYRACSYHNATRKNYAVIDDFYLVELSAFIKSMVKYNKVHVAFVDCAFYIRGDLVQIMFDKSPIIVAHETQTRFLGITVEAHGFSRIVCPENYEEIYIPRGLGTTVWVIKNAEYENLIQELKSYAAKLTK